MDAFLKTGKLAPATADSSTSKRQTLKSATSAAPWVEKYRPRTVDEVAYQDEVVSVLKRSLEGSDLPNLLFYGPPGTGKTSTILAAARDLFGADLYRSRVLELNASDERGIQVVREKVKKFAQQSASGCRPDGKPCPAFKIIILDEADSMTRDAQSALRRTMEKEGKSTKFCLICNYVSRIIEPITSRCAKFRFKPLSRNILQSRLSLIAGKESLELSADAMDALIDTSEGDLRRAITTLQSCASLNMSSTKEDIYEMTGVVPDHWIEQLFELCARKNFSSLQAYVDSLFCEGFSAAQLTLQIHDRVLFSTQLSDQSKCRISECLAVVDSRLLDGANEYIEILHLCSALMAESVAAT